MCMILRIASSRIVGQGRGFTESYWGRIVSGNRNDDFLAAVIFGRFAKTKRG